MMMLNVSKITILYRKIELHKKIINKLSSLREKYYIYHHDAKPEHIFIDGYDDEIQFIDYSLSFV